MPTKSELEVLRGLPLEVKILKTKQRIREWYNHFNGQVYVSFSGGKDSTVLLHLVRSLYPEVKAIFSDTGLEYPELKSFVRTIENVDIVRPSYTFSDVLLKWGYPIASKETAQSIYLSRKYLKSYQINRSGKIVRFGGIIANRMRFLGAYEGSVSETYKAVEQHTMRKTNSQFNLTQWANIAQEAPFRISSYCCDVMKKAPIHKIQKSMDLAPYIGNLTEESERRKQAWLRHGCNSYDNVRKSSQPLSFWTEQDILSYIDLNRLNVASVYGDIVKDERGIRFTGAQRTGCIFCGFGMHLDKGLSRMERLKITHPKLYEYAIGGGQWIENPVYNPSLKAEKDEIGWFPWNPEKIWVPSTRGLGMGFVFDTCNELYGKKLWRY